MIFFSVGIQYVTVENVGDFLVIRVSDTTTALESRLRTQHDSTLKRYSCDELHLSLFSYLCSSAKREALVFRNIRVCVQLNDIGK